jgi:ABC-type polysaccharide/polyol phosphate export permease
MINLRQKSGVHIGNRNQFALAARDLSDGIASIHVWPMLGWLEIKQRYRRSMLGPFWLTLSTGALVGGMGPLYGRLFGLDISTYFPFLAIGFVLWLFLAGLITDACNAFIAAEGYIKQVKLPFTVHVMRMVWRNLIIFAHNAVIVALVLLFWPPAATAHLLLIPPAILLIAVNGIWIGLALGLVCARFRDIPQIIASLVQVAFFLTPIMWPAGMLGKNQWAAAWNPFYHFLELVRSPLVAASTNWTSWAAALGITAAGCAATFLLFARYRARIAYWV